MREYLFHTHWRLDCDLERVWQAIHEVENWPRWWPYVAAVASVRAGDADGRGAVRRIVWTSRLPYRLRFDAEVTRVQRPTFLEVAARGDLEGTGTWRLAAHDGATDVRYAWRVRTTKRWMNLLAPLARPLFARNHDAVMRAGGRGLARYLGARLLTE